MKKYLWMALALCLSMSAIDAPAQSFLDRLGKAVKKEVENRFRPLLCDFHKSYFTKAYPQKQ